MIELNENISSLSSYKHDVLFKKYENITLYKITDYLLKSAEGSTLNNLLTLYGPVIPNDEISVNNFENFKTRLTHYPKIYSITKENGYSENSIDTIYLENSITRDYFQNIETWLNENSSEDSNDLTTFFHYRGNDTNINNEEIQEYIFDTSSDQKYNLTPIKIAAIENLNDLTKINVNTLATIYKYLLRIKGASQNLKDMIDSLREKIKTLSNGLTQESNTSHIEKALMNQATFKIVAKNGEDLRTALNQIDTTTDKKYTRSWYNGGILYAHEYITDKNVANIDRIYFTNNCDVRFGGLSQNGLSGNGMSELKDGTRVLSYYHHQQKYFYYEDIDTEPKTNGETTKFKATLPECKIYLNLDTCMSGANSFGIGYTTTESTGFYFMVNIKPGFRDYVKKLDTNKKSIKDCLDGNWLDICQFIGINKDTANDDGGLYLGEYFAVKLYSSTGANGEDLYPISTEDNSNALIVESGGNWYLNPGCNSASGGYDYNRSGANEFRLAQYYNNGNILGFFAETDESNDQDKYHPLAIYRSDMELPILMTKQYIRSSGNGRHVWYFSVGNKDDDLKDQFIEYIGFKVIVPKVDAGDGTKIDGYFKIMHSETFYEGNMVDGDEIKELADADVSKHDVIPLGRSGVYKRQ